MYWTLFLRSFAWSVAGLLALASTLLFADKRADGLPVGAAFWVVLGLVVLWMGWWSHRLSTKIGHLAEQAERLRKRDLSPESRISRRPQVPDEGDMLADSLESVRGHLVHMLETLQRAVERSSQTSSSLTDFAKGVNVSAGEIALAIEEISKGAELQTELVSRTSTLIAEMVRSIERTSRSAEDAARSSAEASAVAQTGSQMAGQAIDKMRGVFEEIEKTAAQMVQFGERTKEIGNIVRVITEVAQQTHLLAINAAIEAARAGEAGRGFAVVAEEIRQLAENTSRSAERIFGIVEEVTKRSEGAMRAVVGSTQQLGEGRDQLTSIAAALQNIVTTVTSGSDRVQIISRLAREQIAGAEQTVKAFANITHVAQKNAVTTQAVRRVAEAQSTSLLDITRLASEISTLAAAMDGEARRFKVKSDERG